MNGLKAIRTEQAIPLVFAGRQLLLDSAGVVFDLESRSLILADLHLEKAESFARSGQFLPPYDSLATLRRLATLVSHYGPKRIILLGDSFHRADSALAVEGEERCIIAALAQTAELIWLTGNHDPDLPDDLPGVQATALALGNTSLRHQPSSGVEAEIFGHFHPAARLMTRAGSRRRRCFVVSPRRVLLPAFGALTGGLDVREPAIARLFPDPDARAYLLGDQTVHVVPLAAFGPR